MQVTELQKETYNSTYKHNYSHHIYRLKQKKMLFTLLCRDTVKIKTNDYSQQILLASYLPRKQTLLTKKAQLLLD